MALRSPFLHHYHSHTPSHLHNHHHAHRPSRLQNQHFGVGLSPEDLMVPFDIPRYSTVLPKYFKQWINQVNESDSKVCLTKNKFQVNLDVQHFTPEEITVKVTGKNTITVEGKHEEKPDEHGFISREFVRRYVLPEGHDIERIESKLSSDGVLTISAPTTDTEAIEHRVIPIQHTGVPSKTVDLPKQPEQN